MNILLFGKNGQVGWELNRSLQMIGDVTAVGRKEADFSNPQNIRRVVRKIRPEIMVNAAAYTAVDKAEEDEERAEMVNGVVPGVLAEEARKLNALLVHYSTDYVFDGANHAPYKEQDITAPLNTYGRTKLKGEIGIKTAGCDYLIFRTSWVYSSRGGNFLRKLLSLLRERDQVAVVSDQTGSPTSARVIAEATLLCLRRACVQRNDRDFSSNLYHLAASGYTSWYGYACEILRLARECSNESFKSASIKKVTSKEYPTRAKRPLSSCLSTEKLSKDYDIRLPNWKKSLELCIEEISP